MAFSTHFLDEVRGRVRLSDLVGRRVKLTRHGKEHTGLCPFHSEKTPSFTVNDDKAFYHCFGCGKHGSAFDFLMETEGLPFPEAVERVTDMVGMEVPKDSHVDPEVRERQATLYDIMQKAAVVFQSELLGPDGKATRDHIKNRGVTEATAKTFRLGLTPKSRNGLRAALAAQNIDDDQMIEAGLIIRPEDGGEPFDRFRDRLMFPIMDLRGRVIAFGGRALGEARAKYLNSPETPLFKKGRVLYGLNEARDAIREIGTAIVTEGYMDVIALYTAGFKHAVAPLGTALTEEQMGLLWRHAKEPILCLDGDTAGRRAAESAADRSLPLLAPGQSLRFAQVPVGEDPDSLIQKSGAPALSEVLANAISLDELLWSRERGREQILTPEREAGLKRRLEDLGREIKDVSVRESYQRQFRARFAADFPPVERSGRRGGQGGKSWNGERSGKAPVPRKATRELLNSALAKGSNTSSGGGVREETLLALIVEYPELLHTIEEEFSHLDFPPGPLDSLRAAILKESARIPDLDKEMLQNHLKDQGFGGQLDHLALGAGRLAAKPDSTLDQIEAIWRDALAQHRRTALMTHIQSAGADYAADPSEEKQRRVQELQEELGAVQGLKTRGNLLSPA